MAGKFWFEVDFNLGDGCMPVHVAVRADGLTKLIFDGFDTFCGIDDLDVLIEVLTAARMAADGCNNG